MKIDVPITSLIGDELRLVLQRFPEGTVRVKDNKAIWETEMDLSRQPIQQLQRARTEVIEENVRRSLPPPQKQNAFSAVADEIVKSFGG